ncbi:MAG: hypothetical protein ACYCS1_05205 [Gammaproteobacteria bacterium]
MRRYQKNFHKLSKFELMELVSKKINTENSVFDYYFRNTTAKDIRMFINNLPEDKKYCLYDRRANVIDGKINSKRNNENVFHKNLLSFEVAKVRATNYYKKTSIHFYAITEFPVEEDIANIKGMMS